MSLVIAIKDGDRFIIGADKQGTIGGNRTHTATKVWNVAGVENCVMAGAGLMVANQIFQYSSDFISLDDFKGRPFYIDEEYVAMVIARRIQKILLSYEIKTYIGSEESDGSCMVAIPNQFIFAYKDRAWMIGQDLTVEEIDDYVAIGSGADIARGVLYATRNLNPFERIVMAIDAAAQETITVDNYIDCLATVEREDDEHQFDIAAGNCTEQETAEVNADFVANFLELISKDILTEALNKIHMNSEVEEVKEPTEPADDGDGDGRDCHNYVLP